MLEVFVLALSFWRDIDIVMETWMFLSGDFKLFRAPNFYFQVVCFFSFLFSAKKWLCGGKLVTYIIDTLCFKSTYRGLKDSVLHLCLSLMVVVCGVFSACFALNPKGLGVVGTRWDQQATGYELSWRESLTQSSSPDNLYNIYIYICISIYYHMCIYISIYIFFIPSKDSRDNPDPILSHLGCDLRPSMLESGGFLEPVNVFWNFNPPTFRIKTRVMWVPTHTNVYMTLNGWRSRGPIRST